MILRSAWLRFLAVVIAILLLSSAASAQKKKKKDQPVDTSPMPAMPMPVPDQIDIAIGEMLGALQAGDIEAVHKYYADNAVFVRSTYEPPMIGWKNYAALMEQQRAAFQGGISVIRRDTTIFFRGDVAWASYLWQFDSTYQGKPYTVRGQTTLVLTREGQKWLIVHNHTSEICDPSMCGQQIQAQPAPQNPAAAPAPKKP
ncbi:MAG: YybH family protein [Candidatus Acidiferrales bacterium]